MNINLRFQPIRRPLAQAGTVTVTVEDTDGAPKQGLPVFVLDEVTYIGFNGTTDSDGEVIFTLPEGDYRFRADVEDGQYWSGEVNHCTVPGYTSAAVTVPVAPGETVSTTITYTYDPLYRLIAADYDDGAFFHYTYDAVGNRLTQETHEETNTYTYDIANRLVDVDGVSYTWDANGNLLDDSLRTYIYDHANRLTGVIMGEDSYTFTYNGLGDRLQQSVNDVPTNYTLDLNTGLTQVLAEGTNDYLYGVGRIGEEQPEGWQYHLADALGSVRQLTDSKPSVSLAQSYEPFGSVLYTTGLASTIFQFTAEQMDRTELVYLRARYYAPIQGRFLSKDTLLGNTYLPLSHNLWLYALANPATFHDPSGKLPFTVPSGYAEGRVLSIMAFGNYALIQGEEIVYDFFTMESARFNFREVKSPGSPGLCLSLYGISASPYFTYIYGFDEEGLVADWSGHVAVWQIGAEAVVIGGGVAAFVSIDKTTGIPNWDVFGVDIYAEIGLGKNSPIWSAGFAIDTVPSGTYYHNYLDDPDPIRSMKNDIQTGKASPTMWINDRQAAATWAEMWYEEIYR